ncbi:MAG: S-layer homology domain-containing protein [Lachnospiraceae bacterium]|nr:S-layer homology domain-containing protein [Lachnospiraceae bacterium]
MKQKILCIILSAVICLTQTTPAFATQVYETADAGEVSIAESYVNEEDAESVLPEDVSEDSEAVSEAESPLAEIFEPADEVEETGTAVPESEIEEPESEDPETESTDPTLVQNETDEENVFIDGAGTWFRSSQTVKNSATATSVPGPFPDVPKNHVYASAITWAVNKGITKGYSDTGLFGINDTCTRGQILMFLWRYAGKPEPKAAVTSPFSDVPKSHAFYKAILWGSRKGITKGYSNGKFGINDYCTRGQIMTFIWRYRGAPSPKSTKNPFKDSITPAYLKAVIWSYEKGVSRGFSDGTYRDTKPCSRGEAVKFLHNMHLKTASASGSGSETTVVPSTNKYVLNTNTKKFHYSSCSSVKTIKNQHRKDYTGSRSNVIAMGYTPCKRCNP